MKILVVNWQDRLNPQAGGAETHLHEVFGRLAEKGHDVTLLVSGFPGAPPRLQLDGMAVHRVGGRLSFGLHVPGYIKGPLASEAFDVVVEDLNKVPLFLPFWTKVPLVLLVHHLFGKTAFSEAPFPLAAATWLLERPIPRVYHNCPTVAVSQSTVEDLGVRGLEAGKISIVPNGVELETLEPGPEADRFPEPTLLFLGRLKRYKGVEIILKAVASLKAQGIVLRLLVAGKGDHKEALLRLRDRLGLGDIVDFPGYVGEEEKLRLLQRSWIHVLTSPKEGWGIVTLEAAACGTPTVASDSPGLRDAVQHGRTGLLVPHGDVEALARSLRRILENRQERIALGRAARTFAEGYSWDRSAQAMEEALQARVAGAPSQR